MAKGKIDEIIEEAIHHIGVEHYKIAYRDLDSLIEISLSDWLNLSKLNSIPTHRIYKIYKDDKLIFERPFRK